LPADLPLVRADATLVEQAIGNVVANAVSHTPAETHVTIDGRVTGELVVIHVTDDGPGIPADRLDHIFERFTRGSADTGSRADGGEGIGLGLSIAKGIMDAHGGLIEVESPVTGARGTRFTLAFPRKEGP
jgi:two-component system sensor histidine kinase KdpD